MLDTKQNFGWLKNWGDIHTSIFQLGDTHNINYMHKLHLSCHYNHQLVGERLQCTRWKPFPCTSTNVAPGKGDEIIAPACCKFIVRVMVILWADMVKLYMYIQYIFLL